MQTTPKPTVESVLLELMHVYDEHLFRHARKVAHIASAIAGAMVGYDGAQYATIRIAALAHDIGKISVPRQVLRKPGPLTDDEWRIIYRHPIVSERILSAFGLERAARLARFHHEHWNGGGYPDGLAGKEIPLGARITLYCVAVQRSVSVADAFAAMRADLPHQSAQSRFAALAELRRYSGTQFDPEIVETASSVIASWAAVLGNGTSPRQAKSE